MRHLALLLLPLAYGCDPCSGYDGTVVSDPGGLVEESTVTDLQLFVDGWLDAVGDGRECVSKVTFAEQSDDWTTLLMGPTWNIEVDPDAHPYGATWSSLCLALEEAEGLSQRLPGIEEGENPTDAFVTACLSGVPERGWVEEVTAACGADDLTDKERFLLDEVYVHAPGGRTDGALELSVGAAIPVPGVTGASMLAAAADRLAVLSTERGEETETARVHVLDLETGEVTTALEITDEMLGTWLYGGPDGAALGTREGSVDPTRTVHSIAPSGEVTSVATDADYFGEYGAVSGGTLYTATYVGTELVAVDLATGASRAIALPTTEAPREIAVTSLSATEGGVVADLVDAEIERGGDYTSVMAHRTFLARWDAATGEWTELLEDYRGTLGGAIADDVVFMSLYADSGPVLAAYDLAADALLVSDDVCAGEVYPVALNGRLAYGTTVDDVLHVTPIVVTR